MKHKISSGGRKIKPKDPLYDEFYDPTEDFKEEPRAFCYDLAAQFINHAKTDYSSEWYSDANTIKGILLLLFTWNFAARETKNLNFHNVEHLLKANKNNLLKLEKYSIEDADDQAWPLIEEVFREFRLLFGQTGASKALSLLNPKLFVMWDTKIRTRLRKSLITGIMNGENPKHYVHFLQGIQRIIEEYRLKEMLPTNSVLAKKIDEYHYVRIIMNKPDRRVGRRDDKDNKAKRRSLITDKKKKELLVTDFSFEDYLHKKGREKKK